MPDAPPHTNRLINETSPYLLQHAHNPVDWYPWGDEAFEEAQRRGVPVFLSIGYSTCYWCHVMERESFESPDIARVMNERFVCIKVDREERPDLDEIYMAATTTFTGSGGWPMSVFLTPDARKPFYAGTYFPPEPMHNRPAFPELLRGLSQAWMERNDEVIEQANKLADAVAEQVSATSQPAPVGEPHLTKALASLLQRLDQTNGGFSHAPKFPQPVYLEFLLDMRPVADKSTRSAIDLALRTTLDAMAIGGIHDQIAGGFHRYSVDEFWTVPHFEKMLYDNAQLARTFTRASAVLNDEYYAGVARQTLNYCLTEMTDPDNPGVNGFYSAQDAEVDGKEGLNYLWTREEFEAALADHPELLPLAIDLYGLDASPNFQDPHHPSEPRRFVLRLASRFEDFAQRHNLDAPTFFEHLGTINTTLLKYRAQRKQPALDDKVLVSWNAMLIPALVEAGRLFERDDYIKAARNAARFILHTMRDESGTRLRTHRNGTSAIPTLLEDHAHLLEALLALNANPSTVDEFPLDYIMALADETHERFADESGAYFDTRADARDLFVRTRSLHDGATPGSSGVMLHALIELAHRSGEPRFAQRAAKLMQSISATLAEHPLGAINSTRALLTMLARRDRYHELLDFATNDGSDSLQRTKSPVAVLVSTDAFTVSDAAPASFKVALEIEPGYHIVAADPGDSDAAKSLYPLRAGLISGRDIAVYADYPQGEAMGSEAVGRFNAHTGRVEFDIAIEKAPGIGASPGKPVLGISFQACSDTECLQPQTVRLDIEITIE
ncbi:MAG: thioredoxin domain-containing protein [Phycisphaerales bacterium JB052]